VLFGRSGGFGSDVDLLTLDGTDGFRLVTVENDQPDPFSDPPRGDKFGFIYGQVAAGDVNGDGFDDIIIGAYDNYIGGMATGP
jgi:hypothetical protein